MFLDTKLDFQKYFQVNKTIDLLRKLISFITEAQAHLLDLISTMVTSYASFHQKLDSIQYKAALAITGAVRGTSKEKLYNELGLETLEKRRWYRKLCCFLFKCPKYLFNIIPIFVSTYTTRNTNNILLFKVEHNFF